MTKRPDLASITALVADVQEQLEQLNRKGAEADPLDLELFDATVQFLSANVHVYRKSFVPADEVLAPLSQQQEEVVEPKAAAVEIVDVEEKAVSIEEKTVENAVENVVVNTVEDNTVEESTVQKNTVEEKKEEQWTPPIEWEPEPKEVVNVAEETAQEEDDIEFPTRPRSINEILAGQLKAGAYGEPKSGSSRMGEQTRITNLKTAISLNDKLLFIKDLFNGYSLAYSEAIELLNRYDTFEEADEFLQTHYAGKNQWASKVDTANKFYDILKRRYPQS